MVSVKEEIVEALKTAYHPLTSSGLAYSISRPAPTVRRELANLRREKRVFLIDDARPFMYVQPTSSWRWRGECG
jgi:hypothetical protein